MSNLSSKGVNIQLLLVTSGPREETASEIVFSLVALGTGQKKQSVWIPSNH